MVALVEAMRGDTSECVATQTESSSSYYGSRPPLSGQECPMTHVPTRLTQSLEGGSYQCLEGTMWLRKIWAGDVVVALQHGC